MGFALALVGSFVVGYSQGVQSLLGTLNNVVSVDTALMPTFSNMAQEISTEVTTYLQQWGSTNWNEYLAIGVVIAAGGLVLVALGDRKRKNTRFVIPMQAQPIIVEQKE
jgi:hypothetical protein